MKRVDFTMLLKDTSNGDPWFEDVACVLEENELPLDRAKEIVKLYNSYLTPNEFQRRVVSIRINKQINTTSILPHYWEIKSVAQNGIQSVTCKYCGTTGTRRKGFFTVVDSQYNMYQERCPFPVQVALIRKNKK